MAELIPVICISLSAFSLGSVIIYRAFTKENIGLSAEASYPLAAAEREILEHVKAQEALPYDLEKATRMGRTALTLDGISLLLSVGVLAGFASLRSIARDRNGTQVSLARLCAHCDANA